MSYIFKKENNRNSFFSFWHIRNNPVKCVYFRKTKIINEFKNLKARTVETGNEISWALGTDRWMFCE